MRIYFAWVEDDVTISGVTVGAFTAKGGFRSASSPSSLLGDTKTKRGKAI